MKKSIIICAVFLIGILGSLKGKKISHLIFEKPQNKKVCFSVYAGPDYSSNVYKKSKAKIFLSIYKFKNGANGELVWEGVVDEGSVKNYPSLNDPLYREVCVYNVNDRKEVLAAYYRVIYYSKGSELSYENGVTLSTGSNVDSLQVSI